VEFAHLAVFVSSGMLIATGIGWRIGQIMSPRPEALRRAAAMEGADSSAWSGADRPLAGDEQNGGGALPRGARSLRVQPFQAYSLT
jgi:hypothetical protein